jgi:hypothetical protein
MVDNETRVGIGRGGTSEERACVALSSSGALTTAGFIITSDHDTLFHVTNLMLFERHHLIEHSEAAANRYLSTTRRIET